MRWPAPIYPHDVTSASNRIQERLKNARQTFRANDNIAVALLNHRRCKSKMPKPEFRSLYSSDVMDAELSGLATQGDRAFEAIMR